jgi:acyl dehydratase
MKESYYFEDLQIGDEFTSPSRTITEADIVNFAGVSGVFHPIHMDREFAGKSAFGERVAHGPLVMSVSFGLMERTGCLDDTLLALLNLQWKFVLPVKIGDTITVKDRVISKRETKKQDRGIVNFSRNVFNQKGEVVQEGIWSGLVMRREKK